ncbi:chromosome partitioning protein ParA [Shewanella inventionis]|uniref:Chromosome partitioning protein ParA n=1 Tax=Shewanella inventionis TaxID=1738770 RepID=A0ABQ1IXX3_9GAMM|nr:ParA family protein [Shewanella inventionis]GGB52910.1 chromosome partitioning protein ParA [Shewanella inventionis]
MSQETQNKLDALAQSYAGISYDHITTYSCGDAPNGKFYRNYNQREVISAVPEARTGRIINKICDELGIDYKDGNAWRINQQDLNKIKQYFEIKRTGKVERKLTRAQVVLIGILKGGSGKTSTTTLLATGISSIPSRIYKTLVIDLDPQKTASSQLVPNIQVEDITIGDLMMHEGTDAEFEEKLSLSIKKTNFPNLDVIVSGDRDRGYDIYVREKESAAKDGEEYQCYKDLERVIEAVRDQYDIILIDTPPHFVAANLSAHYVAEHLIMPVRPSEYDWDSAGMYVSFLARTYKVLRHLGHKGYKTTKLLISSITPNSNAESRLSQKLRQASGAANYFTSSIPRSDAIVACAEQRCTIFDMSLHEFKGTRSSFLKAQQAITPLVFEFELMINEFEGKE